MDSAFMHTKVRRRFRISKSDTNAAFSLNFRLIEKAKQIPENSQIGSF